MRVSLFFRVPSWSAPWASLLIISLGSVSLSASGCSRAKVLVTVAIPSRSLRVCCFHLNTKFSGPLDLNTSSLQMILKLYLGHVFFCLTEIAWRQNYYVTKHNVPLSPEIHEILYRHTMICILLGFFFLSFFIFFYFLIYFFFDDLRV
jgi:hypothetical protein